LSSLLEAPWFSQYAQRTDDHQGAFVFLFSQLQVESFLLFLLRLVFDSFVNVSSSQALQHCVSGQSTIQSSFS
jgi:hypothetical protein